MTRLRWALAGAAITALLLGWMLLDAAHRRGRGDARADRALVQATGLADLALSSSVRWLRHPSQAEPAAAFSDGPAALDVDPAGALLGPPREVVSAGGIAVQRRAQP